MTLRCRAGDMAVLIQDPACKGRDLGAFLNVVERAPHIANGWVCTRVDGRWLRCFNEIFGAAVPWWSADCEIPDSWLRPIRPPGLAAETVRDVLAEAAQ